MNSSFTAPRRTARDAAQREAQASHTTQVNLLLHLAALKEEHPNDAALACNLVDCFDNGQAAYDWVRKAQRELGFMLDVLALQVALNGKHRAQELPRGH